jgi:hypothetical protein
MLSSRSLLKWKVLFTCFFRNLCYPFSIIFFPSLWQVKLFVTDHRSMHTCSSSHSSCFKWTTSFTSLNSSAKGTLLIAILRTTLEWDCFGTALYLLLVPAHKIEPCIIQKHMFFSFFISFWIFVSTVFEIRCLCLLGQVLYHLSHAPILLFFCF